MLNYNSNESHLPGTTLTELVSDSGVTIGFVSIDWLAGQDTRTVPDIVQGSKNIATFVNALRSTVCTTHALVYLSHIGLGSFHLINFDHEVVS